jgi:hypothetical protein
LQGAYKSYFCSQLLFSGARDRFRFIYCGRNNNKKIPCFFFLLIQFSRAG